MDKLAVRACRFRPRGKQPLGGGASGSEPQPLNLRRIEAALSQTLTNGDIRQIQKTCGMV